MAKFVIVALAAAILKLIAAETFQSTFDVREFHSGSPVKLQGAVKTELFFPYVQGVIPNGTFVNLPETTRLQIENYIFYVEPGAFLGLDNLKTLDLSWNQIGFLIPGTFNGLNELKSLSLRGNAISYMQSGTFTNLRHLEYLNLDYNYQLHVLTNESFDGLASLRELSLNHCKISRIEAGAFSQLTSLKNVSLDHNLLTEFPASLHACPTLTHLNIAYNQIERISNELLYSLLNHLKLIDISGNPSVCSKSVQKKVKQANDVVFIGECDNEA